MPPDEPYVPREASRTASFADRAVFAAQFVRAPVATASVWPSSAALARSVADAALKDIPSVAVPGVTGSAPVVVELGAGSGAFTGLLTRRLAGRGRQLAVEFNPLLAQRLAERFAHVEVVPADVAELPTLLASRGIGAADVVVSGLGWSATRPGREDPLLPVVARGLTDDGVFVQLAYCATSRAAPARALREELAACFHDVETSPVVWRNLPPAVVHRASRPRR